MPAYRSSAEADIRDAVVTRLRDIRPGSRIIHEINVSSYGTNRMDLLAVGEAELIAVEIKSARDKLDRLPKQMEAMKACAHHGIVALHEKFLIEQRTNKWAAHYERDGELYLKTLPNGLLDHEAWVFPEGKRAMADADYDPLARWRSPEERFHVAAPAGALNLLWRNELEDLCSVVGVQVPRRSAMGPMMRALRWRCSGEVLTKGICAALRRRQCVEADAPISDGRIAA